MSSENATKQRIGPYNQHDFLHPHYGAQDCCLCKEEQKVAKLKETLRNLKEKLLEKQVPLDPEIQKIVDDNFWELL